MLEKKVRSSTAAYLSLRPNTYAVPIAVYGTEAILPPDAHIPRKFGPVIVTYGKPISTEELKSRIQASSQIEFDQLLIDEVMYEIANLLPEKYRGVYARVA